MTTYELKLSMPYVKCDNFKEKDLINLLGVINGCRIKDYIQGYKYGILSFEDDDVKRLNPSVLEIDSFLRLKTNCIIFDIVNKTKYNKVFVYQSINRENNYYGIVGLKNNGESVHVYNIELDYAKLVINLLRMVK